MIEDARTLLTFRPILPAGTHAATTVQATVSRMKEKLNELIERRNSLDEATEQLALQDLRDRDSWFWSEELQELEETGLNASIRRYIDYDQKNHRIREEETLVELEKRNLNLNVTEIINILNAHIVESDSSRLSIALQLQASET